jgi:hypothetical protein
LGEQDLMLHSEFRDGNVPVGFERLRMLQDVLALLPDDLRGLQILLLSYCSGFDRTIELLAAAIRARIARVAVCYCSV